MGSASRRVPRRPTACVYCGAAGPLTRDHIPPRSLFPRPRPSNLITVPCCQHCNAAASGQDEYFRVALALHGNALDHPGLQGLRPEVIRALSKPEKQGFATEIARRTTLKTIRTEDGQEFQAFQHHVDQFRIGPVVERITIGLYYHHFQQPLAEDHIVVGAMEHQMDIPLVGDVAKMIRSQPLNDIGDGVFKYQYFRPDEQKDPAMSVWLLTFYNAVPFLTVTVPRGPQTGERRWPPKRDSGARRFLPVA